MSNQSGISPSLAPLLLAIGAGGMLSGCVAAAIAPLAAGGLMGGSAARRHHHAKAQLAAGGHDRPKASPVAAVVPAKTAPTPAAADVMPVAARRPPPPTAAARSVAPPVVKSTTWDDVARSTAKMAVRTPDRLKTDVLRLPEDRTPSLCGAKPTAILIDAATLGGGDYLYVGALQTMGFEIVLMSPAKTLAADQVRGLAKQGIATPIPGQTLFVSAPGGEATARAAIAGRYCVVGLVGNRPADFPGGVLPGTPTARDGWFLVTKP